MAVQCCSSPSSCSPIRGWLAVLGGFLVHLTLGTLYCFGNMSPYLTSYLRAYVKPDIRATDSIWIFGLTAGFQGAAMFLGGIINTRCGTRLTTLIGGFILSAGSLLTALAVRQSFELTMLTYGAMCGVGIGIAYAPPLACAMKWLPEHKGLVNGIVVAGFGGGAFIFDQIQTAFINPDNLSPDKPVSPGSNEKYFSPEHAAGLLHRVPQCFVLLGGIFAIIQLIGCLLLSDPPATNNAETHRLIDDINDESTNINEDERPSILSLHPKQVLRTRPFWTLWSIFLLNGLAVLFTSTLYKTYGETFIEDDYFLAMLGSIASVGNSCGRIIWGKLVDKVPFKFCMMILCFLMTLLMSTLMLSPHGGKAMFFLWICLIFLIFSGNFVLLPTATARAFGPRYVAINYGFVFTSQALTGLVGSILTTSLNSVIGWTGMFLLVAAFSFISLILTATFNVRNGDGKHI